MQNQRITIEVIESKEFHVAARGYNQHEVDEFLDSICDEMERLENEMATLKAENNRLKNQAVPQTAAAAVPVAAPVVSAATPDGTFREILEMAQQVKEQTIADAKAKAEEIVADAEVQVRARLGNLTEEKEALEAQVAAMKAAAAAYKEKFTELLTVAKDALDAAEKM